MAGLTMRAYHGMASNYSADEIERYDVFGESGWSRTRLSGILAMLLMYYPDMPYSAIAAFADANGFSDWEFTVDPDDDAMVGGSGSPVYFVEGYELPGFSEWSADFTAWKNGEIVSELPAIPTPATIINDDDFSDIPAQPAPMPNVVPAVYHPQSEFESSMATAPAKPAGATNWIPYAVGGVLLYLLMTKKKRR